MQVDDLARRKSRKAIPLSAPPSLRGAASRRSNPGCVGGEILDCLVASAPRNDGVWSTGVACSNMCTIDDRSSRRKRNPLRVGPGSRLRTTLGGSRTQRICHWQQLKPSLMIVCRKSLGHDMRHLCLAVTLMLATRPVLAIDCNRAKSDVEHAICGDAQAGIADRELGASYDRLRASLSGDERAGLRSSQVAWIGSRDATCKAKLADAPLSKCLAEQSEMRRRFLDGEAETGDAGDIRYRPTFIFRPAKKGVAGLSVEALRFVGSGTWQAKANATIDKMVKGAIDDTQLDDDQLPGPSETYYVKLRISLPFANPRLLSVHAQYNNYLGQAHEFRWESDLNIETPAGRELTFDRSVDRDKADGLFQYCRSQVLKEKSESADEHGLSGSQASEVDLQELTEDTKDLSHWAFSKTGVVIDYGDYAFGGYGACMCSCVVPYSHLGTTMRQDLRLP
jgi:uncharacterized protein YecT (DUF1311 family)